MTTRVSQSERFRQEIAPFLEEWEELGLNGWQQFRNWSVQQVLWQYGLSTADIEEATNIDGPRDKGIDAWYYEPEDEDATPRLILIQAKDTQIKREDFSKAKDGFLDVVLPDRPGQPNQSLREIASEFRQNMPASFKLDIYLTSSVLAQQNLQPSADGAALYAESMEIGESRADASFYVRDIQYLAQNIQVIDSNPIEYRFNVDSNSFFEFNVGGHTRTICAALKATELAALFQDKRENLFRKNPRYYLFMSAKNKEIKTSLYEPQNEDFFVYNNGLTCIAQSVSVDYDNAQQPVIRVNDFQIVNGCQTVASVWSASTDRDADISKVRVLAKIIENPRAGAEADLISERIALRSNSQNPLKAEDWKSNDARQEKWQAAFQRLPDPWFYEIKRGVWATEYSRSSDKKAPFRVGQTNQHRKMTMKDLGQACYAFLGYPAEALDKARDIFERSTQYELVFRSDLQPIQLLLPYLVFQEANKKTKQVSTYNHPTEEDFEIKTEHLRFAIVHAIGYMLATLAGKSQDYCSVDDAELLVQNRDTWLPRFIDQAFDQLANQLVSESFTRGTGPRSIVRRNDWMGRAVENAAYLIQQLLQMETATGLTGEGSLRHALPRPMVS